MLVVAKYCPPTGAKIKKNSCYTRHWHSKSVYGLIRLFEDFAIPKLNSSKLEHSVLQCG